MKNKIEKAAQVIFEGKNIAVFTGAGISAESGIPTFRGTDGVWTKYNPKVLELNYFHSQPEKSWKVISKLFYSFIDNAQPNPAHFALAEIEKIKGKISIITQNIDHFHQLAGNIDVIEFHGTTAYLNCLKCGTKIEANTSALSQIPPRCAVCNSILKPDFVFFGEGIPPEAYSKAFNIANKCDVMIVVGTSGEVMPARMVPFEAKKNGAIIIEINPEKNMFALSGNDIFIKAKAVEALSAILGSLKTKL